MSLISSAGQAQQGLWRLHSQKVTAYQCIDIFFISWIAALLTSFAPRNDTGCGSLFKNICEALKNL